MLHGTTECACSETFFHSNLFCPWDNPYILFFFPSFSMSCSPSGCSGGKSCPCVYAPWFPRIAFGLVMIAFGVSHYKDVSGFSAMSSGAFASVPMLASVAGMLAYIVPALMIVGGALFAVKQLCCISKTCILASLSGIIGWAALAVLVGDPSAGGNFMPAIQNAGILLILYWVVKKMSCCGGGSCAPTTK